MTLDQYTLLTVLNMFISVYNNVINKEISLFILKKMANLVDGY